MGERGRIFKRAKASNRYAALHLWMVRVEGFHLGIDEGKRHSRNLQEECSNG